MYCTGVMYQLGDAASLPSLPLSPLHLLSDAAARSHWRSALWVGNIPPPPQHHHPNTTTPKPPFLQRHHVTIYDCFNLFVCLCVHLRTYDCCFLANGGNLSSINDYMSTPHCVPQTQVFLTAVGDDEISPQRPNRVNNSSVIFH